MLKSLLNLKGVQKLTKRTQKSINGGGPIVNDEDCGPAEMGNLPIGCPCSQTSECSNQVYGVRTKCWYGICTPY